MLVVVIARLLLLLGLGRGLGPTPVTGGTCWSAAERSGRCTDLLQQKVSREECCATPGAATAWSAEDMDAGALFFWRVLARGVPCVPCKASCTGVTCGPGLKCALRWGRPQCVCAPDCSRSRTRTTRAERGPVCGTDGRSYRSACRLKKRACRRKTSSLSIAYYGTCQTSCDLVRCGVGRSCVLDQNLTPHCVSCARICSSRVSTSRAVCGADGTTYESACRLREAACRKGKAIPVAYRGQCKKVATCGAVRCRERQSCLSDLTTGTPRCVTCSYRCPRPKKINGRNVGAGSGVASAPGTGDRPLALTGGSNTETALVESTTAFGGAICGSNNRTYLSWCHMLRDACATGFVIETLHPGSCKDGKQNGSGSLSLDNIVLDNIDDFS